MKHNTLKKILSLLLVICMMASFAGCIPGEEDPTEPTEAETEPPATEAPNTDPTFATDVPTESPVETFVDVVETVYAISTVNARSGPSTDDMIVGSLSYGESVQRTGIGNKGWSRVIYNGTEGIAGANIDSLVESGLVTDTFCFGPPILVNGSVTAGSDGSRAQRTFIGTNGNPGDIWIVVSEGRNADGESAGLTYSQCAR